MSMDYLLVLCSVLLPLAAAVEGKIRVVVVRLFGFLERVREARFSLVAFVAWELGKQATPIPLTTRSVDMCVIWNIRVVESGICNGFIFHFCTSRSYLTVGCGRLLVFYTSKMDGAFVVM